MRFGMNATEAEEAAAAKGGGSNYLGYLKYGENSMYILEEPDAWVYFWEHFVPDGFSFPCTQDEHCEGCKSENPKIQKTSMRVAFNVKQDDYINAIKVPYTVSEKLKNRFSRRSTITDREYIITKYKVGEKVDYDVEAGDVGQPKVDKADFNNIEKMLADSYDEAWGDPDAVKSSKIKSEDKAKERELKEKLAAEHAAQSADPPSEPSAERDQAEGEITVTESELRKMEPKALKIMCVENYEKLPPASKKSTDAIVDWMMAQAE